jgi:hypothetical protein
MLTRHRRGRADAPFRKHDLAFACRLRVRAGTADIGHQTRPPLAKDVVTMKKISLPWQRTRTRRVAPEVRAGFPAASIPVLTEALCVYRPEQLMNLPPVPAIRLWNDSFRHIPPAVWSLKELEVLELVGNRRLEELSAAVGGLPRLRSLVLRDCSALRALPDAVRGLAALETLDLAGCSALERLPAMLLRDLPRLRRLDLRGCNSLQAAPHGRDADPDLFVLLPPHLAHARVRSAPTRAVGAWLGVPQIRAWGRRAAAPAGHAIATAARSAAGLRLVG